VMLPVTGPCAAAELMRALIVVAATVPAVGVSVTELEKVVPPLEISTPVGAVMTMGAVKLVPLTVKVAAVPAVPAVVVPKLSVLGVTVTVGVATALTVPVTATSFPTRRASDLVMLPVTVPCAAAELMRALIV